MTQPSLFPSVSPAPRPVSPFASEKVRRESNRDRVLARLRQGPAFNHELVSIGGMRCMGRVWELQKLGHDISIEHLHGGVWVVTLREEPKP